MACHINTIIAVTFPNTCYFLIRRVKCRKTHDITSKPTCKIRLMISETCSSIIAHCIMQINLTHLHSSYIYMLYDVLILNWHGYYNIFFPGSAPIMINDFSFRWHMALTISGCLITLYYALFLYVCLRSSYCYRPINPCVNIIPYKKRQRFLPMSPLYQLLVAKTQSVHKCWQKWLLEN